MPGDKPQIDTNLKRGELITAIDLPPLAYGKRARYIKLRDRNSYAFALVSVAAMVDTADDGTARHVHIALGGVAHKPWRAQKAERVLTGKKLSAPLLRAAAEAELAEAKTFEGNAFKVELARRTIVRAVTEAAGQGA